MNSNVFADAAALSDRALLQRLDVLAGQERGVSAELVAHLAALEARPSAYASLGFGSLFSYCTGAQRLSEDAACNRIEAARVCRRFPGILDLLSSGALSLTSVRLLRRHLTPENHRWVLARASGRSRREIESLIAELAPRPDVASSVRKIPMPSEATPAASTPASPLISASTAPTLESAALPLPADAPRAMPPAPPTPILHERRPVVQATAPERYRVQFAIGAGSARSVAAASGPPATRDPERRSRPHFRARDGSAVGARREDEGGGGEAAGIAQVYPSRDG
jgi:hypothetical protein